MRIISLDLDKKTAFATWYDSQTQSITHQGRFGLEPKSLEAFSNSLTPDDILLWEACPGSYALYVRLHPLVKDIKVANPVLIGSMSRVAHQKSDRNDSRRQLFLFLAGMLPTVHIPSEQTWNDRLAVQHYKDLDKFRTACRNRVHSLLTECGLGPRSAELLKMDMTLLLANVGAHLSAVAYANLASALRLLAAVDDEVELAHARLTMEGAERPDVQIAASLPGVDTVIGLALTASISDVSRFETPGSLSNYAGVTPSEHSSGKGKHKHGSITRRGSKVLRWAAVEAARNAIKTAGRFRNIFWRLRRRGKDPNEALVAVANEILKVLWYLLTRRETYRDVTPSFQEKKDKRRVQKLVKARKTLAGRPNDRASIDAGFLNIVQALGKSA